MEVRNKIKREQCYSSLKMIKNRETGLQFLRQDTLASRYHKHVQRSCSYNEEHGAIFNLDFSPSGKMLVVACEKCAILLYDPATKKRVHKLPKAHRNSVNTICFCDERIFASGSDDNTIALWDTRMLNEAVTKFSGHTNWVKSLLYDKNTGLLITSAFDGTVCIWDINKFSCADNCPSSRIYVETSLSRIMLTPSGDKLVISCRDVAGDHIMLIIHNLDLANLADDIFDKDVSQVTRYVLEHEDHKRNIPEKLDIHSEYPNIPFYIPSLAMHPHGSCLVSRCLTKTGLDQFTAVHDIQSFTYGKSSVCLIGIKKVN